MAYPASKTAAVDNATPMLATQLNALEDKVGINDSADPNSLDYAVNHASGVVQSHINDTENPHGVAAAQILPDMTGHAGEALMNNGSVIYWGSANPAVFDYASLADGGYIGPRHTGVVGETVAVGQTVYLKSADSRWWKTLATAEGTMSISPRIVLDISEGGSAGDTVILGLPGCFLRNDAWGFTTNGAGLYQSDVTPGALSASAPNTLGYIVQPMALVTDVDNIIHFNPDPTYAEVGSGSTIIRVPHAWTMLDAVDARTFPGFTVSLPSGQSAAIVKATYQIGSGTSILATLQKNGSDITDPDYDQVTVGTTPASTTANVALADGDYISLKTETPSGAPTDLSYTVFVEYTK
jgi:hypothetical protein